MAATTVDEAEIRRRKNGTFMFEGQQYYRCAPTWRRRKSARRSRIPSPPPPPPSPSSPSEETIYLKPSPWPRRLKIAVRSKPPEPEEAAAEEHAMPSASPSTTRASGCSGISIPVSSVGDNFSPPPPPSDYSPSPSSPSSSGSVTSPFYYDRR